MSLRERPAEGTTELPDGREVTVRVEVPADDYLPQDQLGQSLLVRDEQHVLAAINTVLAPEQEEEAAALVREALAGLSSGEARADRRLGSSALGDSIPDIRARSQAFP